MAAKPKRLCRYFLVKEAAFASEPLSMRRIRNGSWSIKGVAQVAELETSHIVMDRLVYRLRLFSEPL